MPIRQTSQPLMGRRKYYIELLCITTVHIMLPCNSQCQPCNSRACSAIPVPTVQTWHGRHRSATAFYLCLVEEDGAGCLGGFPAASRFAVIFLYVLPSGNPLGQSAAPWDWL